MGKSVAVGLDIGTSSIKLVQIKKGRSGLQIEHYGVFPLPFGAMEGGAISNPQIIADYINQAMSNFRIRKKDAVIAVAGQSIIVRHVKFPLMDRQELEGTLQFEADRYIPYPIDEACIDFEIVGRDEANNEVEVMLVAAQKQLIESHVTTLKLAGIQPLAIDVQPFALIRALGLLENPGSNTVVILDIGAGTTDLLIYKSGSPRFTRIIPIAGNRFTQAIASEYNCSMDEAESLKIKYGDALKTENGTEDVKVNNAIRGVLDELVLEVRRSIDYYRLQQRIEGVDQIIIAGGGAKLHNCEEFFSRELGMRVIRGNSLNLLNVNNASQDMFEMAPVLSVGIGLALREVE